MNHRTFHNSIVLHDVITTLKKVFANYLRPSKLRKLQIFSKYSFILTFLHLLVVEYTSLMNSAMADETFEE